MGGSSIATETFLPTGERVGATDWIAVPSGSDWEAVNSGVDTPDDTDYIESEIVTDSEGFSFDNGSITDGDTVTNVKIRVRSEKISTLGLDRLGVMLHIGGINRVKIIIAPTTTIANYDVNDPTWNSDWTASEINGMEARFETRQNGMVQPINLRIYEVEIVVTYTEAAAGGVVRKLSGPGGGIAGDGGISGVGGGIAGSPTNIIIPNLRLVA